jgi:RNA ligase
MITIFDMFDRELFEQCYHDDLITLRSHPTLPLVIANYSPLCAHGHNWNPVTLSSRGLIYDANTFEVVARPWKKFFNYGESNFIADVTDRVKIQVTDKADGSLGILYPTDDGYAIATRGSFTSEQALHATGVWFDKYNDVEPLNGWTFLFEIVYPANRIVLDYKGMDDLILLGAVKNDYGYYVGPEYARALLGWLGPVVESFDFETLSDAAANLYRPNAEGFVVRHGSEMVKLKQEDYLELHRIVTNINPKTIWERVSAGDQMSNLIAVLPDEFQKYATDIVTKLVTDFDSLRGQVFREFDIVKRNLPKKWTRKDFALAIVDHPLKKFLFLMLDNRSIDGVVWEHIKPKATDYDETDDEQGSVWK